MSEGILKFGVKFEKIWDGFWNIGICLAHTVDHETYLFINLLKWSFSIGKMYFYEDEDKEAV